MKKLLGLIAIVAILASCTENYSNGERIGLVTQFSKTGVIWKSWEGELHVTQTGMNSTMNDFNFSIDNDNEPAGLVNTLDSAAEYGWKVKLKYHETAGWNWFGNRGSTDHFITECEVLDKTPVQSALGGGHTGKVVDTIYVIIDKSK